MTRPQFSMARRYCGTSNPDQFLMDAAERFVAEVLDPFENLTGKHQNIVRLKRRSIVPSRARDGAGAAWIKIFSAYEGDECIVFPFSTAASPRGSLVFNFKKMEAHRAMCLKVNKLPPEPNMMALHKCGNGHLGCVTPKHLYWGDRSNNAKDARRHMVEGKPECVRA